MKKNITLNPYKHEIYFKNSSCADLKTCGALCCKKWDINLALIEYQQDIYKSEPFCSLDKSTCRNTSKACPNRAWRLKKKEDGACIYLDEDDRCSIYSWRPIVCRNFSCDKGFSLEPVVSVSFQCEDEAEVFSFEGGFDLKTKFLFNPYLTLKKVEKKKNYTTLIFKDTTSCKEKIVKLRAVRGFFSKKEAALYLSLFNGKNDLAKIIRESAKVMGREDCLNLAAYLVDENVLVGIF
jgi:Fe-S-cluster containining protein